MTEPDWATRLAEAAGDGAEVGDAYGVPVLEVPAERWVATLTAARDAGLTFFDWLSAVDELDEGFSVVAHVADPGRHPVLHVLVRTRVRRDTARLRTATGIYAGASWHERETHEMFGIDFEDHPHLDPLLLPDGFEGHPLRKEFVLAARAAKPWPGAKEPGEGHEAAAPARRRMMPPGVPDPQTWGPRAPVDERPGDEGPGDEAPVDEGPGDEAPVDEGPGDEAPGGRRTADRQGEP